MSEPIAAPSAPAEAGGLNLLARFWGILTAPRATYADVVARPRWFGMVVVVVLVGLIAGTAIMATSVGRTAALDAARTQMESFGIKLSAEAEAQMEQAINDMPLWRMMLQSTVTQAIMALLVPVIFAGLLFVVFNAMLGGDATFKQLLATIVNASPVQVVGVIVSTPIMYLKESMTGVTNVGVLLPMLDESGFLAKFLGSIDLIRVWWIIVLSIGLSVLYKRKSAPIAATLFVIYGVIAVAWAAFQASRAGA
jgi:hypothetical protein